MATDGMHRKQRAWLYDAAALSAIGIGILCQLWRFLENRNLRYDEARLALNVIERGFAALTRPLSYEQAAPVGFLWVQRTLLLCLGNSEQSLRLLPLLCSMVAPLVFWRFTRGFSARSAAALATSWFALHPHILSYATEVKHYALDVLATVGLLAFGAWLTRTRLTPSRLALLALLGAACIWFSHPTVLVLAGIAVALVGRVLQPEPGTNALVRSGRRSLLIGLGLVILFWTASFLTEYLVILRHTIDQEWTRDYWQQWFAPFPPSRIEHLAWYFGALEEILISCRTPTHLGLLLLPAFLLGAVHSVRARPLVAAMLLVPTLAALTASTIGLYGFHERLVLFLQPATVILTATGVWRLLKTLSLRFPVAAEVTWWTVLLSTAVPMVIILLTYPVQWNRMDVTPQMHRFASNVECDDALYVARSVLYPFRYYAPRCTTRLGLSIDRCCATIEGVYEGQSLEGYEAELDQLLAVRPDIRRVWFLTSRVYWRSRVDLCPALDNWLRCKDTNVVRFDGFGVALYRFSIPPARATGK